MAFCFNDDDVKAERAQWNEVMVCGQQPYAMYIRQGSEEEVTDRDGFLGAAHGSPEIASAKRGLSREFQHGQMCEGAVELMKLCQVFHAPAGFEEANHIEAGRAGLYGFMHLADSATGSPAEITEDIGVARHPHFQRAL